MSSDLDLSQLGEMTSPPMKRSSQSPPVATSNANGNGNGNANAGRSLARPPPRSNFDLEPNPFEHSFSSTSVSHGETPKQDAASSNEHIRTGSGSNKALSNNVANGSTTSNNEKDDESKPMLPPLAAIESPAGQGYGPWALHSSLRSGPLSPAMLAGPTTQQTPSLGLGAFDSSFVRTGLTPDVSRTGLTPLIGGPGGFPPPSPNTAALFALVNGTSASAPLGSNVAITPGTLNAITGALNQSLNAIHQPTSMSLEQPQSMVDHQQNNNGSYPNSDAFSAHDSASHAISNAASALYLLSQQQSLQRQQQQQHQNQAQGQGQVNPSAVSGPPQPAMEESPTVASTRRATKRKTMDAPAPVPRGKKARSASTSGAAAAAAASAGISTRGAAKRKSSKMEEDDEDDFDEDDEDNDEYMEGINQLAGMSVSGRSGGGGGSSRSKKPETEEEKRRNFLERNRQAALKCRQRKKAWLTALQAKVEFLTAENERLSNALVTSREEVARLSQAVVAQGGAPSALLNLDPNGPNANGSTILSSVNGTGGDSRSSPIDHARRNSGSSSTTGQPTIQSSQSMHVNVPPTMSSGMNHGMTHHGHSHSLGHNAVGGVGGMGHNRSHSHGHGHTGVPAQNGVTVGGRGYGY